MSQNELLKKATIELYKDIEPTLRKDSIYSIEESQEHFYKKDEWKELGNRLRHMLSITGLP